MAALVATMAVPAGAQVEEWGVGAGVSVPVYEAADARGPGPHALVYAGYRLGPTLQLRGEGSFTQLGGDTEDGAVMGDLRVVGLSASLVWSPAGTGSGAYGFGGLGMYSLRDSDAGTNPDGMVPGVNLGVGVNARVGGVAFFGQAGLQVPFTSFGTGTESAPPMYLPFVVGIRIPCCGGTSGG